jgi:hypothetical protein
MGHGNGTAKSKTIFGMKRRIKMKPSKLAKRIVDIFYNGTFLSRKDAAKEVQRILDAEKSGKKGKVKQ